ncbi:MAG: hypothetical protein JWM90_2364 [Thermoleophilia bacterium]|nr:hypothetical protein [Thermoleophilia bacterium]
MVVFGGCSPDDHDAQAGSDRATIRASSSIDLVLNAVAGSGGQVMSTIPPLNPSGDADYQLFVVVGRTCHGKDGQTQLVPLCRKAILDATRTGSQLFIRWDDKTKASDREQFVKGSNVEALTRFKDIYFKTYRAGDRETLEASDCDYTRSVPCRRRTCVTQRLPARSDRSLPAFLKACSKVGTTKELTGKVKFVEAT